MAETRKRLDERTQGRIPVAQYFASTSTGTDSYAITLSPAHTAYEVGREYIFKADVANSGSASLNVDGLGAKTLKKNSTSDLSSNDILAGAIIVCIYDGTYMQIVGGINGYTIFVAGTSGETLASNDLVYLKSSDNKWYKGVDGTDSWNVSHIVYTGASLGNEAIIIPLNGRIPLSTAVSANTTYYRSSTGTLTSTKPSLSSSSIVPILIGTTDSAGNLVCNKQRLQRRLFTYFTPTAADRTITVGFPISHVFSQHLGYDGVISQQYASGYYDAIANTQVSAYGNNLIGSNVGSGTTYTAYTASVVSNNLLLTWAGNSVVGAQQVLLQIYEAL